MEQPSAFETLLRTGRRDVTRARPVEVKFNPYHDPRNGRFTFAPGGAASGRARSRDVNGHGYVSRKGDDRTLARMIFAESLQFPGDFEAIGWSIVNRVGQRQYGMTLDQILRQKNAFEIVEEGGGPKGGSPLWRLSAQPERMTGSTLVGWQRATAVAKGILSGGIPDPTGGGTLFFSSDRFDGTAASAEGDFERMLRQRRIAPSKYVSVAKGKRRQYFFIERPAPTRPTR